MDNIHFVDSLLIVSIIASQYRQVNITEHIELFTI